MVDPLTLVGIVLIAEIHVQLVIEHLARANSVNVVNLLPTRFITLFLYCIYILFHIRIIKLSLLLFSKQ